MYYNAQTTIESICQSRWYSPTVVMSTVVGEPPLTAPMDFENVPLENADSFEYVFRPRITFLGAVNKGIGASCQRYSGRLDMCIFHKSGSGVSLALSAADDICKYLNNKRFGDCNFLVGKVSKLPGEFLGWVQTIASFPFEFDLRS